MFGLSLEILRSRENSELPILVSNIISRLINSKIDYTIKPTSQDINICDSVIKKIKQGQLINLSDFSTTVCIELLRYFIKNVPLGSITDPLEKGFHSAIYYLVDKTTDNKLSSYLSLYHHGLHKHVKGIYDTFDDMTNSSIMCEIKIKPLPLYQKLKDLKFKYISGSGKRILTIDGGGMKGIVAIKTLSYIAKHLYGSDDEVATKRLMSNFDMVGGTSAGAIIAVALSCGYSLSGIRTFFLKMGADVFNNSWKKYPINILNYYYTGDYYSHKLLVSLFDNIYKGKNMVDIHAKKIFVVSTLSNTNIYEPYLFKNYDNIASPYNGTTSSTISDSLRASSAAPTYFSPYINESGQKFKDGGLIANNPTEIAIFESYNTFPNHSIDLILSIGTGKMSVSSGSDSLIGLSIDLLNIVTNSDLIHGRVIEWVKDYCPSINYFRFSPDDLGSVKLDTTDMHVLENCEILTDRYLDKESSRISELAKFFH